MQDSHDAQEEESSALVPSRSVRTAYLMLLVAGLFGAHRFYLGRVGSGLVYVVVLVLAMIGFVLELLYAMLAGLAIDAFLIPSMVRRRNKQLAREFEEHPERFVVLDQGDNIAPWARQRPNRFLRILGTPLRVFAFLALPMLAASFAVQFETYELVVIPIVILMAVGLLSSLDQLVVRYPALEEIPGVGPAIHRVGEMREYYWNNEPRVVTSIFSFFTRAFTEYRPYWKIVGFVVLAIAVETLFSYEQNYPPYLGPGHAAETFFVLAFSVAVGVFMNLVPLTTLSFRYSLAGQRKRLAILTIAALIMTGVGFMAARQLEKDDDVPSLLSELRLELRMNNFEFRDDLKRKIGAFLTYYNFYETDDYVMQLRDSLAGIAKNDEPDAFDLWIGDTFAGVIYKADSGPCVLTDDADGADGPQPPAVGPSFHLLSVLDISATFIGINDTGGVEEIVYHAWEDLPPAMRAELERRLPPTCRKLIDEYPAETTA